MALNLFAGFVRKYTALVVYGVNQIDVGLL